MGWIRHSLFASSDTGISSHLVLRYRAWPTAARGIAVLFVDKFRVYAFADTGLLVISHYIWRLICFVLREIATKPLVT